MFESLKKIFTSGRPLALRTEVLQKDSDASEHFLYGLVGEDITASTVISSLKNASGDIEIHLFSLGGDLFEAAAIYGILNQYPGKVTIYIEGLAASAGAYIAVGADELVMEENAMLMIHNAWKIASGNHNELREQADLVEKQQEAMVKAFISKSGQTREDIISLMDEETWMDAEEALDAGFANRIYTNEHKVAATIDADSIRQLNFKKIPEKLKQETDQQTTNDMTLSKESLEILGLPEDATEEQVNDALANADINLSNGKSETADEETADHGDEPAAINEELEAKLNSLQKRLDQKEEAEREQRAETLVNSAVDTGKINPADKPAWLNSAKTDFDGTKKALDERKANSSMPGKVSVDEDAAENGDTKQDATKACANYLRGQMKMSKTG